MDDSRKKILEEAFDSPEGISLLSMHTMNVIHLSSIAAGNRDLRKAFGTEDKGKIGRIVGAITETALERFKVEARNTFGVKLKNTANITSTASDEGEPRVTLTDSDGNKLVDTAETDFIKSLKKKS